MTSKAVKGFLWVVVVEAKGLPDIGTGSDQIDSFASVFLDNMEGFLCGCDFCCHGFELLRSDFRFAEGTTVPAFDTTTPSWNKKFKIKVPGKLFSLCAVMFIDAIPVCFAGCRSIHVVERSVVRRMRRNEPPWCR